MIQQQIKIILIFLLLLYSCTSKVRETESVIKNTNQDSLLNLKKVLIPPLYNQNLIDSNLYNMYYHLASKTGGELRTVINSESLSKEIIEIINNSKRNADILFLMDRTGSMLDDIINVKTGIIDIIRSLDSFKEVRVSIALYGDKLYDGTEWFVYENFDTNLDSFKRFVKRVRIIDGGDVPESVYEAFFEFQEQEFWKSNNKRMIILIGDAAPVEKPRSKYSVEDLISASKQDSIYMNFYPILIAPDDTAYTAKKRKQYEKKKLIKSISPNPTSDIYTIEFQSNDRYNYELFNDKGEKLEENEFDGIKYKGDLSKYKGRLFVIRVSNNNMDFESMKVIKN